MRRILTAFAVVFVLVLLTYASTGTAQAWSPGYHVVCRGETMYSIAARYGLSAWALANANGIWNPNLIYVGQVLVIPGTGYCYTCYNRPYYNPYPYYKNPYPYNYYKPYYPNKPYYPQQPGPYRVPVYGCSYRVTYGDTMTSIAARFGTSAWNLASANGISNMNWIYAGQMLRIPGCN